MLSKSVGFVIVLIMMFWVFPLCGQVPANTPKVTQSGQEYYKYNVEKGIGLYRIAINFGVSQDDIIKMNPSVVQGLVEGQTLLIPVVSSAPKKTGTMVQHTVEKGQTLYSISAKYAVSIDAITAQNPAVKEGLYDGMVLMIPQGDDFTVKSNEGRTDTKGYAMHTVQPKETLYGISGKYGLTVDDVLADNPGLRETGLQAGTVVRIREAKPVVAAEKGTSDKSSQQPREFVLIHFHKVMAGDNFHVLTRKYQVPYGSLVSANPSLDPATIAVGTIVAIPKNPLENKDLLQTNWYVSHKVAKKETLYAITKKYGCTNDVIKLFNPNVDLGNLPKGQTLYLPTVEWMDASKNYSLPVKPVQTAREELLLANDCNGYSYFTAKPTLNVVFLMPFNLKTTSVEVGTGNVTGSVHATPLSGRTKMVVEFYEGFLMGINRWKEQGVNIRLVTIDSGTEMADIKKVLARSELKEANLIVGPAYPEQVKAVSEFSIANKIKMIVPFGASSNLIYGNPNLFSTSIPDSLATETMAKHMVSQGANTNLVVVRSSGGSTDETRLMSALRRQQAAKGAVQSLELKEVVFSKSTGTSISSLMSREKNNIIVVPSSSEVFVGQVLIALDAIAERNQYPMEVYGMQDWLKFQTVDPESFHRMNGRLFTSHAIDYDQADTKSFVAEFRQLYASEPVAFVPLFQPNTAGTAYNRYGGLGFDIAHFFVGALVKYGPTFETCVANMDNSKLVQSSFKFKRISNWGGFYNNGLFVLKFNRDLSTQRILVE